MYIYNHDDVVIIITLYVDDLLVAGSSTQVIETVKKKLDKFKMSDIGDVSLVLGMEGTRDRENGTLSIFREKSTKSFVNGLAWGAATP